MSREIIVEDEHNPGVYIVKLVVDRPSSSGELLGKISKPINFSAWTKYSTRNSNKAKSSSKSKTA